MSINHSLTIGTRTSALAMWQTEHVIKCLTAAWPGLDCVVQPFTTVGDKSQAQNQPLPAIGGKGLFTLELEDALRSGAIDLAVHSLKDLPVDDAPGLTLGAITQRADVRDGLVARNGWTLATLPSGARVGTSSTRRAAQLLAQRPDLDVIPIRGNVDTRARKVQHGDYDATVLAAAGLVRLGMTAVVTEWLPLAVMLPAPGQGALAVQCRADDAATLTLLSKLDDPIVRAAVTAERHFLHLLGGGCSAPVAAYAEALADDPDQVALTALIGAPDGRRIIRVQGKGRPQAVAAALADEAMRQGAAQLLGSNPDPQPLAGRRIVVTRAEDQAAGLVAQLAELGAQPIIVPAIRIVPLPDLSLLDQAIAAIKEYDWLIFTSANAVRILAERMRTRNVAHANLNQCAIAAIGPATADALGELGVAATFVPETFVAEALAGGLGDVAQKRILLPQAAVARAALVELLTAQGAQVDAIPIYNTEPAPVDAVQQAELANGVDAILFTSGSTARNFLTAVSQDAVVQAQVEQALLACIGPVTAQVVEELGARVGLVAEEATTASLVQALIEYFSVQPHLSGLNASAQG